MSIRHRTSAAPMASSADQDIEMNGMSDTNPPGPVVSANSQQAELIDAVKLEILGAPHQGWRQFFYMLDPYKQEQFVRAPKMYMDINMYFSIIYFTFIILFTIYAFLAYVNQDSISVNSMVSASTLPPVYLNITTICSGAHQCGNWTKSGTGQWSEQNGVILSQSWNYVSSSSPCYGKSQSYTIPDQTTVIVPVCYSLNSQDGVFLTTPFTSTYTSNVFLNVILTGDQTHYANGMYSSVEMQPSQSKTVFFSQNKYVSTDSVVTYEPYAADFFYNGHGTSTNTATLALRLQQFGYSTTQSYAFTLLTTAAQIGGFATLWLTLTTMFRGVVVMFQKSICELREESAAGLGMNAFQLFLVVCCRCAGLATLCNNH